MPCSVSWFVTQLLFGLIYLFGGLSFAFQEQAGNSSLEPIRAELLVQRMREHGVRSERNAIGGYVQRIYNNVSNSTMEVKLESIKSTMEKAKASRIEFERKNNIKSDLDALNRQMEEDFASLKKQLTDNQTTTTIAVRFTQQKYDYRVEQFDLNHEDKLEKLASDLRSGKTKFVPTYTRTWNGKEYAELFLDNRAKDPQAKPQELDGSFAALGYKNKAGDLVRFTRISRDSVDDPKSFKKLT